jgi:O-acetyl-ADP-ribose deacetylase (regulator of RNase III)
MIEFTKGNLLASSDGVLVNTVNTVGVMGKGIALQFKDAFPHNFGVYADACKKGELYPGKLLIVKDYSPYYGEKTIVNFPTKVHWRNPSQYEYIEKGLVELKKYLIDEKVYSISIPPLGCGNGGLEWKRVKAMIVSYLSDVASTIHVYEPNAKVDSFLKKSSMPVGKVELTPARAMMLYALFYYETLGEPSNLFVANKLAYFMQRLGEPAFKKLRFTKANFGPYCQQVGKDLHELNGKYVRGLEQMSLRAYDPLTLQYDTLEEVKQYVEKELSAESRARLKQLITLISGFQSTLSLEVLASVDYIRNQNPGISYEETVQKVWEWSDRKKRLFKEQYIRIAFDHLNLVQGRLM